MASRKNQTFLRHAVVYHTIGAAANMCACSLIVARTLRTSLLTHSRLEGKRRAFAISSSGGFMVHEMTEVDVVFRVGSVFAEA